MNVLKSILFLAIASTILCSCSDERKIYQIYDPPEFNAEYRLVALKAINNALEDYPSNADAHYKKATFLFELEDLDAAKLSMQKAIELDERNPKFRLLLAEIYLKQGDNEGVNRESQKAVELGLNDIRYYKVLAEYSFNEEKYDQALSFINQAIDEDPNNHENFYRKGRILKEMLRFAEAEKLLRLSLVLNSYHLPTYYELIDLKIKTDSIGQAIELLDEALVRHEDNEDLQYLKVDIFRENYQMDSAILVLEGMLERDSVDYRALVSQVRNYETVKDLNSAQFFAERLDRNYPESSEAKELLGAVYLRRGFLNLSRSLLEQSIALDSTNEVSKNLYIQASYRLRKSIEMKKKFEERPQIEVLSPRKSKN